MRKRLNSLLAMGAFACVACHVSPPGGPRDDGGIEFDSSNAGDEDGDDDSEGTDAAEIAPPDRVQLRRLTRDQYANAIHDLLGSDIAVPTQIDPDLVEHLYSGVGAASVATSPLGAEQFDAAAREIAAVVFASDATALVGCDPSASGCYDDFARTFGRRAFRRPLEDSEAERYVALGDELSSIHEDPRMGAEGILASILASPSFLYIGELGEPDPDAEERLRFTSLEMASRLSFAIWGSVPDAALLDAGTSGELVTPKEIKREAARLIADHKARRGLGRFVAEWLGIDLIANLTKDAEAYPDATPELFEAMQGELERVAESVAFDPDRSMLDLIDGRETFVDARLAAHYGVAPPTDSDAGGFGLVSMGDEVGRRGLLGTAAVLAAQSRRTRTSPTLRGIFVQRRLLCDELPPPPPDVEMDLPNDGDAGVVASVREQLEEHRKNPACASCHEKVDPIGLALEHFDAVGAFRSKDGGVPIDASADLNGVAFDGLAELAAALREDPALAQCIVRQVYRFTTGHLESEGEDAAIEALAATFEQTDHSLVRFLPHFFASASFRTLAAPK